MNDWLSERSGSSPSHPALIFERYVWTYAELDACVSQLCGRLAARGVMPGQRVAAYLPNRPEYVALIHALARLGTVLLPLNTRLTAPEIAFQLGAAQVDWLIYGDGTAPGITALPVRVGAIPLDSDTLTGGRDPNWGARPINLSDPAAILFTSGTTGQPKGVVLTWGNFHHSALASAQRLGSGPDDRWLVCLPLYHVGGLSIVLRCCLFGTTVVLHERFEAGAVAGALPGVTLVSLVPTMLRRVLAVLEARDFPANVRAVLLGGAAAPAGWVAECAARGVPVALTYGLTEASSQVATATPAEVRRKPGSVGKPLGGVELRIANYANDHVGEILVRGPIVMAGYLGEVPVGEGWLSTGDLGWLDEDSDLLVVQRRADLIVTGGENVYPAEVEAALLAHPAVREACVVGLADAEWGQIVGAVVVVGWGEAFAEDPCDSRRRLAANASPLHGGPEEELNTFLRERLAGYKIPRHWRFTDELPQTASGKVSRNAVLALFEQTIGIEAQDVDH